MDYSAINFREIEYFILDKVSDIFKKMKPEMLKELDKCTKDHFEEFLEDIETLQHADWSGYEKETLENLNMNFKYHGDTLEKFQKSFREDLDSDLDVIIDEIIEKISEETEYLDKTELGRTYNTHGSIIEDKKMIALRKELIDEIFKKYDNFEHIFDELLKIFDELSEELELV